MSERPRVFVARRLPDEGLDAITAACDADIWQDELPPPRDELLRRVAGCDGVLTLLTDRVDDEFLDAAGPSCGSSATTRSASTTSTSRPAPRAASRSATRRAS